MQTSTFSIPFKGAILGAALALCGVVYAAEPATAVAAPATQSAAAQDTAATHHSKHQWHKQGRGHHASNAAMFVPGYGPLNVKLVDSLGLNDSQKASLQAAQEARKEIRQSRRTAMKSLAQSRMEQLKAGTIDPHAALKQRQESQIQSQAARQELDNKWLAVWDTLDAGQREKVTAYFNERAEKFAKHAQEHRQKHSEKSAAKIAS